MAAEQHPIAAPLPWQAGAWRRFLGAHTAGRVPHALLLGGVAGTGKRALADAMAARLLCEADRGAPACGRCRGCRLRFAGSHPDAVFIEPEEAGSGILKIESARALTDFSQRTSQYAGYRVARLQPAEAMNRHTANALLKTLEEPPPGMVLILVSHEPGQLPATLRSRCQQYRLGIPPASQALDWLQGEGVADAAELLALAGGAPVAARELAEHDGRERVAALVAAVDAVVAGERGVVEAASEWHAVGALETTRLMQRLVWQLMRDRATGSKPRFGPAGAERLGERLDLERLGRLADRLAGLRGAATRSLARELSIEALFALWSEA